MPWKNESRQQQRLRLVEALLRGEATVAATCRYFGISRQTGYKFLRRFRAEGRLGLGDRSRRPRSCSKQRQRWRRRVLRLRSQWPTWGTRKLRAKLHWRHPRQRLPSERTIGRWLREEGLTRRRTHKRHATGVKTTWTKARGPNDVWTVDFKGWFRTKSGQRIEPLTVRDHYSKYLLAVESITVGVEPVRRVFRRLFSRYGLPRAIRSDRGAPFCGSGPHGLTQLSLCGIDWAFRSSLPIAASGPTTTLTKTCTGSCKPKWPPGPAGRDAPSLPPCAAGAASSTTNAPTRLWAWQHQPLTTTPAPVVLLVYAHLVILQTG